MIPAPRILHLLAPGEVGGLETVVRQLSRGQFRRGQAVRVALVSPGLAVSAFVRDGGLIGVPLDVIDVPSRGYLRERSAVAGLLALHSTNVLHTHGYRPDVLDAGVARKLGIATVTTVHGFTGGSRRNRFYEALQIRAFRRFGAVVAVARPLGELLLRRGVPAHRLHVIPNAYDTASEFLSREDARKVLGVPGDVPTIGWVGRISKEKGADVFLEALGKLPDRHWRAVIVGEGAERAHLEHRGEAAIPTNIHWAGNVPQASRLYRAFDLFVLSSRTEGTPMALLEAMAADVPVVATSVGGVPDIITAREGWVVPAESPSLLAGAIAEALGNPREASQRAQRAGARLRSELAMDSWLDRYDELYASLI